jgi:hypothetical protein
MRAEPPTAIHAPSKRVFKLSRGHYSMVPRDAAECTHRTNQKKEQRQSIAAHFQRMGRDSNPRYGFPYTRFPGVHLKPLGHPSRWQQLANTATSN